MDTGINEKGDAVTSSHNTHTTRNVRWGLISCSTGLLVAVGLISGGIVLWLLIATAIAINLAGWLEMDRIDRTIRRRNDRRAHTRRPRPPVEARRSARSTR
jgi:hypothetical protein